MTHWRDRLAISSVAALITTVLVVAPSDSGALESSAGAAGITSAPWTHLPGVAFQPVSTTDATEQIYVQQCAPCHGSNGKGDSAPSLQTSLLSAAERTEFIRDGRAAMPAFGPTLTDEEVEAISDFTGEFIGAGIYTEQCAPCHGVDGSGDVGPSLLVEDLSASEVSEVIANGRSAMPAFGATLTDEHLASVSSFTLDLSSNPATGSSIYAVHCALCHGDDREGGIGPPLLDAYLDLENQMSIVRNGRDAMPAFGLTLTEEQLGVLESYLAQTSDDSPPPTKTGEDLYAADCAGCHGANLEGGLGPALDTTRLSEADISAIIAEGQGGMQGFGETYSADDLIAVAAFVIASATPASEPPEEPPEAPENDSRVAADLYADNCRTCHGPSGEGGAGPTLLGLTSSEAELTSVIADGRGSMPGFGSAFSESEMSAMVSFTAALTPETEIGTPDQAIAADGLSLFLGHCSECHGDAGEGRTGPTLAGVSLSANEIVVHVWSGHPDMPAFHETLTPDEILAVSSYAAGLPPADSAAEGVESSIGWPQVIGLALAALVAVGIAVVTLVRRARSRKEPKAESKPTSPG